MRRLSELKRLPPLRAGRASTHANVVDYALRGLPSKDSRRTYASRLDSVAELLGYASARELPWEAVQAEHLDTCKRHLLEIDRQGTGAVNATISAVRRASRTAHALGRMSSEALQDVLKVRFAKPPSEPEMKQDTLTPADIRAIVSKALANGSNAGVRDAAIVALLYGAALERRELHALNIEDFNAKTRVLTVANVDKRLPLAYRKLQLPATAVAHLNSWLALRGDTRGALFVAVKKGGRASNERLSQQSIGNIARQRGADAGLEGTTPGALRRAATAELIKRGHDLAEVQRMLGHASPATTEKYDERAHALLTRPRDLLVDR